MKTITLTDQAYKRLKDWKGSEKDSFSSVVLKVVPEKGTLGQMLEDVGRMKPLSTRQAKVMEDTVKWGRDTGKSRDRWTS
jgi:predicted CopG family antitoxin